MCDPNLRMRFVPTDGFSRPGIAARCLGVVQESMAG